jgi:myosin-5
MAEMLGVDGEQMRKWLCNRKITTANEVLVKPLTKKEVSLRRQFIDFFIY